MKKTIQQILDEEREKSEINKIPSAKINRTLANKNKATDPNFKQAMVKAKVGKKRPDMLGDKNPAHTPEERKRRKELFLGVKKSPEQVEKYKQAYKQFPMIVCPHCKKESKNQGNMNRYHFDNCKYK